MKSKISDNGKLAIENLPFRFHNKKTNTNFCHAQVATYYRGYTSVIDASSTDNNIDFPLD